MTAHQLVKLLVFGVGTLLWTQLVLWRLRWRDRPRCPTCGQRRP